MSLCTRARKNSIHWSEGAEKADVRHERLVASKESPVCASVIAVVSEPKENGNSEGLKSDKSV